MNAQKANNTKDKVRQLQRNLYLAAKGNSKRRFHALYDKIGRTDVLTEAWKRVRSKKGTGGIDGVSIETIEVQGVEGFLDEIQQELKQGTYRPQPVKRVYIPKADGNKRPLGIPNIRDRVVQMAAKIAIEPVFEADFKTCSYGFRPKRNMRQALEIVRKESDVWGSWVVEADIKSYFDNINHEKLMILIQQRISDRRVLKLIGQWLKSGVMTETGYEESSIGSPQGGVISPLLANIYLNLFDTLWEKYANHLGQLVRYADDLVIITRNRKNAERALEVLKVVMAKLELTLHPVKTRLIAMWSSKEGFDFLGLHHRVMEVENNKGKRYRAIHQIPSRKAMKKMKEAVKRELAPRAVLHQEMGALIESLNLKIRGWRNHYGYKKAAKWLRKIDWYILIRLVIWWNKKHRKRKTLSGISYVRNQALRRGLETMVVPCMPQGEECRKAV